MRIALVCPASLPATQFGGILFLAVDIATELSKEGHVTTIFTTDLDFANNPKFFNKKLPRIEKVNNFLINRTHVWFAYKLFFVNPGIYSQLIKDKPDIIHTIGVRSFQSFAAALSCGTRPATRVEQFPVFHPTRAWKRVPSCKLLPGANHKQTPPGRPTDLVIYQTPPPRTILRIVS